MPCAKGLAQESLLSGNFCSLLPGAQTGEALQGSLCVEGSGLQSRPSNGPGAPAHALQPPPFQRESGSCFSRCEWKAAC